jgi:hypothetical protein
MGKMQYGGRGHPIQHAHINQWKHFYTCVHKLGGDVCRPWHAMVLPCLSLIIQSTEQNRCEHLNSYVSVCSYICYRYETISADRLQF